ncbi:anthocyanidin 3-O-glucosyltransferase 5-like [Carica papaya]|uniref:anthocyanidin 3-O-glucosyltransferase 5-like n=1 Tax=Carica papaya TaxID=3649 RepID=UPI000B8C8273|nr:anthocyanidin 3-O-glucosyltransferase 5-like [Carica papaya]
MVVATPNKTHVAVLSSPGLGHIIPLLELAKRLVIYHDSHVSFLNITTTESSAAQDHLLRSPSLPNGLDIVDLPRVDVATVCSPDIPIAHKIGVIVEESLQSLKSLLIDLGKPKALVIDLFCTQAFEICSQLDIPTYLFFTTSTAFFAFCLYLPTLDHEVEGELVDLPEPIEVPGCTPVRPEDLADPVRHRKTDDYQLFVLLSSRFPLAAGIFLNSWDDLEPVALKAIRENTFYKQIHAPPVYPVGPLVKQDEPLSSKDAEYLAWLDKQPSESVLFVSFGSGGTLSTEQLRELAWGLELSQQRFTWVVRPPCDTASGTFFNVGSELNDPKTYLPEGFLERTNALGLVIPSWAPQTTVLRHPSTGGFLSHCGWNSSLESITHGVPMITWPLYAEQRTNATFLTEEVKLAIRPEVERGKTVVRREEIERVVRVLMEGEEGKAIRCRVKELKDSALKSLDYGGSSYESLSCVAKQWRLN